MLVRGTTQEGDFIEGLAIVTAVIKNISKEGDLSFIKAGKQGSYVTGER